MVKRRIPLKNLGLNLSSVGVNELEDLAIRINEEVIRKLSKLLTRNEDYAVNIKLDKSENGINLLIDLRVEGKEPITPELNALLDEVVSEAFEIAEHELKRRFGKS